VYAVLPQEERSDQNRDHAYEDGDLSADEPIELLGQLGFEGIESVVDGLEPAVDGLEPAVDDLEPVVDGFESAVDGLEPAVDRLEPAVNDVKPPLQAVESAFQAIEPSLETVHTPFQFGDSGIQLDFRHRHPMDC